MSVEFKYAPRKGLGRLLIDINAVQPEERRTATEPVRIEFEQLVHSRFESYLSDESGLGPVMLNWSSFRRRRSRLRISFWETQCGEITSVTISGEKTGIVGGAVPIGGALMSLERMNRIVGIKWDATCLGVAANR